jgi:predicted RNase H-like HicB family nuclease
MGPKQVTVKAEWAPEAKVWVVSSDDIPGLITEAETVEALAEKFSIMIPSY